MKNWIVLLVTLVSTEVMVADVGNPTEIKVKKLNWEEFAMFRLLFFLFSFLSHSVHAGETEKVLAQALASLELDRVIEDLDAKRAKKDSRGMGKFEFMSAMYDGSSFTGGKCNFHKEEVFILVYENFYGSAQKATIRTTIESGEKSCVTEPSSVKVDVINVVDTGGPILK